MSRVCTCELCGVNPFDDPAELERHAGEPASNAEHGLPWNDRSMLDGISTPVGRLDASGRQAPIRP